MIRGNKKMDGAKGFVLGWELGQWKVQCVPGSILSFPPAQVAYFKRPPQLVTPADSKGTPFEDGRPEDELVSEALTTTQNAEILLRGASDAADGARLQVCFRILLSE